MVRAIWMWLMASADNLDKSKWRFGYSSLSNGPNVSAQLILTLAPNRAFGESPIQVVVPLDAVIVHKRANRPSPR